MHDDCLIGIEKKTHIDQLTVCNCSGSEATTIRQKQLGFEVSLCLMLMANQQWAISS